MHLGGACATEDQVLHQVSQPGDSLHPRPAHGVQASVYGDAGVDRHGLTAGFLNNIFGLSWASLRIACAENIWCLHAWFT
jgi:hypothetical protein